MDPAFCGGMKSTGGRVGAGAPGLGVGEDAGDLVCGLVEVVRLEPGGSAGLAELFEPVGVLAPDIGAAAEAVFERGPATAGEAAEGAAGGECAGLFAGEGELFEEVVVGVDPGDSGARGESGGEAESSPVAPLAVNVTRVDAGGLVEVEEGDVGAAVGAQGQELVEEGVAGDHEGP